MGEDRRSSRRDSKVEPIGTILDRWLRRERVRRRFDPSGVFRRWKEVVGETIASRTRVTDLDGGVLVVEVNSAVLLQELSTFYREEILESLREIEEFGSIRDIRFRVGSFKDHPTGD